MIAHRQRIIRHHTDGRDLPTATKHTTFRHREIRVSWENYLLELTIHVRDVPDPDEFLREIRREVHLSDNELSRFHAFLWGFIR